MKNNNQEKKNTTIIKDIEKKFGLHLGYKNDAELHYELISRGLPSLSKLLKITHNTIQLIMRNSIAINLDFIQDDYLREIIQTSNDYIFVLYGLLNDVHSSAHAEETHRVIILYTVSIIEGVLMYLYKLQNNLMYNIEYKHIIHLPNDYTHQGEGEANIVVAVQKKVHKLDRQIGLVELVSFFKNSGDMKTDTAEEILKINDVRNTFHFNKARDRIPCTIEQVEKALGLFVYIIEKAPRRLIHKTN